MSWHADVTVAALIERAERFLVVEERIGGRLVLNQPAGHLERGESLLEAVRREVREETARPFTPRALLGVYLWHGVRARTTVRVAIIGSVGRRVAGRPFDKPVVATHWLSREQLAAEAPRLRTPLVLRCIDDYLGGRRLPLSALASI